MNSCCCTSVLDCTHIFPIETLECTRNGTTAAKAPASVPARNGVKIALIPGSMWQPRRRTGLAFSRPSPTDAHMPARPRPRIYAVR
jgi:hypothetical protein